MRIRVKIDLTQEQLDIEFDRTLLSLHSQFAKWVVELQTPIVHYSLSWHEVEGSTDPHLFVTLELMDNAPVEIDSAFFDDLHLGGSGDG